MYNTKLAVLLSAMLMSAAVSAQDAGAPDKIVLESKNGSVMASNGGEYQTANLGQQMAAGQGLMLGDGAKAKLVYYYYDDNEKLIRKCVEDYVGTNTYVIDDACESAGWAKTGSNGAATAIIVGAGLVGAAILANEDNTSIAPISAGPHVPSN